MEEKLSNEKLTDVHSGLLASTRLDHMTFPTGPKKDEDKKDESHLSDKDIKDLLESVNCKVRKIVHGENARHVYFWSPDNRARKDGLDMAYKLKGDYAPEKRVNLNAKVDLSNNPNAEKIAKKYEEELRDELTK